MKKINSFKIFNEKKSVEDIIETLKEELFQYVCHITDEYQMDTRDDVFAYTPKKKGVAIEFRYENIITKYDDLNFILDKFERISKAIKKDFSLDCILEGIYTKGDKTSTENFTTTLRHIPFIKDMNKKMYNTRIKDGVETVRYNLIIEGLYITNH